MVTSTWRTGFAVVWALGAIGCGGPGGGQATQCSPVDDAFLMLELTGALTQSIDWTAQGTGTDQLACGSVGLEDGLDLALAGQADDGSQLSVSVSIDGIGEGETGSFTGDLTIGSELGLYGTTDGGCTFDIDTQSALGADAVADGYRIEGTGTCDTLTDLFDTQKATASGLAFRAVAVYLRQ